MLESISSLLASLKAATPQILIGIAIFCGVMLLSPAGFTAKLGLGAFVEANRAYLGSGFVASACILLAQFLWWVKDFLLIPIETLRRRRTQNRFMSELTPDEKAYLLRYIEEQQNTQYFRIDDGISQGLVAKGIIFQHLVSGTWKMGGPTICSLGPVVIWHGIRKRLPEQTSLRSLCLVARRPTIANLCARLTIRSSGPLRRSVA